MKYLPIISVFIVSLIFATIVVFFSPSAGFSAPAASKAGHRISVASQHIKFITYKKVD
jgi:hypothetical protein